VWRVVWTGGIQRLGSLQELARQLKAWLQYGAPRLQQPPARRGRPSGSRSRRTSRSGVEAAVSGSTESASVKEPVIVTPEETRTVPPTGPCDQGARVSVNGQTIVFVVQQLNRHAKMHASTSVVDLMQKLKILKPVVFHPEQHGTVIEQLRAAQVVFSLHKPTTSPALYHAPWVDTDGFTPATATAPKLSANDVR
jgi:hypothetical protein